MTQISLPFALALPPLVAGLVVLVAIAVRRVYRSERARLLQPASAGAVEPVAHGPASDGLGAARAFYYAGTLLVGAQVLRAGSFTVSDGLYLVSLALGAGVLIARRRPVDAGLPALLVFATLLFAFGGLISSFGAAAPLASLSVVVRVVYLVLGWFWLGTVVLTRPEHVRTAVLMFVVSAALAGAMAVAQVVTASDIVPVADAYSFGRASGLTTVATDLGGLTAVAIVPALNALRTGSGYGPAERCVAAACLPFILAGLLFWGRSPPRSAPWSASPCGPSRRAPTRS